LGEEEVAVYKYPVHQQSAQIYDLVYKTTRKRQEAKEKTNNNKINITFASPSS
jgi:hypothetical protein